MSAKDKFNASPAAIDSNDFDYGGTAGGANTAEGNDAVSSIMAGLQAAPTLNFDPSNASLGAATSDLNAGEQALGTLGQYNANAQSNLSQQLSNLGSLYNQATDTTLSPNSLASLQMQQNLQQSNASGATLADSAQGGGGASALAARAGIMQAGGANQTAALNSATLGQNQQIAAQQSYNTALGQYGSADASVAGANQGYAAGQATAAAANQATASQQAAQQTSAASNAQAQQQLNNQNQQFYSNQAQTIANEQLTARENYANLQSGNANAATNINAGISAANAAAQNALINSSIAAGASAAGSLAKMSDVRVKENIEPEDGSKGSLAYVATNGDRRNTWDKLTPYKSR